MSAYGYERTFWGPSIYVRFTPESGPFSSLAFMSAIDPKRTFIGICGSARDEVTHHPNRSDRLPAGRLPLHYMPRPDLWTLRGADSRITGGGTLGRGE